MAITLSVIIPAYNAQETVIAAIRSALGQTRRPEQVVVCNDGSTDKTGGILNDFSDPPVKVVHQDNRGVSAASNTATHASHADFVVKLDADDTWHETRLEAIEDHLARYPHHDIVTTDAWVLGKGRARTRAYDRIEFPDERRQDVEILRKNFIFGSAAVRREALLSVGGWDEGRSHQGEYDGWVNLILSGSRAGLVPSPLAIYNKRSASHSADKVSVHRSVIELMRSTLQQHTLSDDQVEACCEHICTRVHRLRIEEARESLSGFVMDSTRDRCQEALKSSGLSWREFVLLAVGSVSPRVGRLLMQAASRPR